MSHSTNYRTTLITVAADCAALLSAPPAKPGTVAGMQYEMLAARPYQLTSDELLRAVEQARKGADAAARLFDKPQACLRASPLVKQYGFGLHHDAEARVALVPVESDDYARLLADPEVKKRPGMRSSRN